MDNAYGQLDGVREHFAQALSVLATVVSRPAADRAVLDIGRKTLGVDHGTPRAKGYDVEFVSFSEEHAKLALHGPGRNLRVGDLVEVVPGHGCTTINLYDRYVALRGGVVEAVWPVAARGRAQ